MSDRDGLWSQNLLTNLTDLSRLQQLRTLKLTDNQLEVLPDSLFKLSGAFLPILRLLLSYL